jgi:hypothetical protein
VDAAPAHCPAALVAPRLPILRSAGILRGDVDGDGRGDRVVIRYAPRAPAQCAFFIVVGRRVIRFVRTDFDEWGGTPAVEFAATYDVPRLLYLLRIERRGLMIGVIPWHGATASTVQLIAVRGSRLARMRFSGSVGMTLQAAVLRRSSTTCVGIRTGMIRIGGASIDGDYQRADIGFEVLRVRGNAFIHVRSTHGVIRGKRRLERLMMPGLGRCIAAIAIRPFSPGLRPCPSRSAVQGLPRASSNLLYGDVDGDGRRERVTIRYEPRAPARCAFFVVAGRLKPLRLEAADFRLETKGMDTLAKELRPPSLTDLLPFERRGLAIALYPTDVRGGFGFVVARHGALRRLRISALPRAALIYAGGPATLPTNIDCVGHGRNGLLATILGAFGPHSSTLTKKRYRIEGVKLRLISSTTRKLPPEQIRVPYPFFSHCRGRR